jgi:hypothetical protein
MSIVYNALGVSEWLSESVRPLLAWLRYAVFCLKMETNVRKYFIIERKTIALPRYITQLNERGSAAALGNCNIILHDVKWLFKYTYNVGLICFTCDVN